MELAYTRWDFSMKEDVFRIPPKCLGVAEGSIAYISPYLPQAHTPGEIKYAAFTRNHESVS